MPIGVPTEIPSQFIREGPLEVLFDVPPEIFCRALLEITLADYPRISYSVPPRVSSVVDVGILFTVPPRIRSE